MDFLPNWQLYVSLGLILIIIEAFASSFFLFPIGVSFIFVALIAPFANLTTELVVFSILVTVNFFISLKFIKPHFVEKKFLTGMDSLVGRVVLVQEEVNEQKETGYVKVYADEWKALPTETGQVIQKNTKVKIDKVDGNKVYVSKIL